MRGMITDVLRDAGLVVMCTLAMVGLTGLSFLVTRGFGYRAYSDRLVWVGIALTALGGVGGIVATAKDSVEQRAQAERASEEGERDESSPAVRRRSDPNFGLPFRLWIAGVLCIGAGIALDLLTG